MSDEWIGPWYCKTCGKPFKCQDVDDNCTSKSKVATEGCYCNEHTLFLNKEYKIERCHVTPFIRDSHPRKGRLISGVELPQL